MRSLLTLLCIGLLTFYSAAQEVDNGGFENWSTTFLFEDPDNWRTGNSESGLSTTSRISDAPQGNYAAHLETKIANGDTAFGFALLGKFDEAPENGVAFTTNIRTLNCWMRHDLVGNDSALVLAVVWSGGLVVAAKEWRFGGAQPTWSQVALQFDAEIANVDSVLVGVTSSDPFSSADPQHGSWIDVDELRLTAPSVVVPDLLPNHDFEDWTDFSAEDPDGWSTWNRFTAVFGATPVTKSPDAYSGMYSARLESISIEGITLPGSLTNGSIQGGTSGGAPYASTPGQWMGAYKYQPVGSDMASISVLFTNNGAFVGSASMDITAATPAWTPFAVLVNLFGIPDSMRVVVFAGENPGSVLYVDDLDLSGGNVGIADRQALGQAPYPNPATDRITLPARAGDHASILDASGRLLHSTTASVSGPLDLPLDGLAPGAYVITLRSAGTTQRHPFVKAGN